MKRMQREGLPAKKRRQGLQGDQAKVEEQGRQGEGDVRGRRGEGRRLMLRRRRSSHALAPIRPFEPTAPAAAGRKAVGVPLTMAREDVGGTIDSGIGYLVSGPEGGRVLGRRRAEDARGGFALNTYRSWRLASHAISTMALAAVDETPESRAALEAACATWPPANCRYETVTGTSTTSGRASTASSPAWSSSAILASPRNGALGDLRAPLMARAQRFLDVLLKHQAATGAGRTTTIRRSTASRPGRPASARRWSSRRWLRPEAMASRSPCGRSSVPAGTSSVRAPERRVHLRPRPDPAGCGASSTST